MAPRWMPLFVSHQYVTLCPVIKIEISDRERPEKMLRGQLIAPCFCVIMKLYTVMHPFSMVTRVIS